MLCLNLDDTLDMVYICMFSIYREFLKPTITANCGRAMFQPKIEQPKLYFTTKAKPSSPNKHQLKYTLTTSSRNHYQTLRIYTTFDVSPNQPTKHNTHESEKRHEQNNTTEQFSFGGNINIHINVYTDTSNQHKKQNYKSCEHPKTNRINNRKQNQ